MDRRWGRKRILVVHEENDNRAAPLVESVSSLVAAVRPMYLQINRPGLCSGREAPPLAPTAVPLTLHHKFTRQTPNSYHWTVKTRRLEYNTCGKRN